MDHHRGDQRLRTAPRRPGRRRRPAGHPLDPLNPLPYQLRGPASGITDTTRGTNTDHGITGYPALPGYDLASGLGTVGNAAAFVPALTRLSASLAAGRAPPRLCPSFLPRPT
jgi:hypothetical protein